MKTLNCIKELFLVSFWISANGTHARIRCHTQENHQVIDTGTKSVKSRKHQTGWDGASVLNQIIFHEYMLQRLGTLFTPIVVQVYEG